MDKLPFRITVYGRPGCHLCDDVEKMIKRVAKDFPLIMTSVDITIDDELHLKYLLMIPVVEIDGDEVFPSISSVVSENELREELRRRSVLIT